MYPPIVCRCGLSLGHIAEAYRELVNKKFLMEFERRFPEKKISELFPKAKNISEYMKHLDWEFSRDDILDALGISMECCRTVMITNREFKDFY